MEKLCLGFIFMFMVTFVHGKADDPKTVLSWFNNLPNMTLKTTQLHFYFHDILSGKNPTAIKVVEANTTKQYRTAFGVVYMMDDPLTEGPEPNSTIVGRSQGLYASAGQESLGLLMTTNFVFTNGKYSGSTLSILGRNPALETYREMPIVGGSGVFRLARGVATAKTHFFDPKTGDAIVEYNVIVLHY